MCGGASLVVLDRYDDSDARLRAHRNVPRPAPAAEVVDERHWRVPGDILEWSNDPARAHIAGSLEVAPYRDKPEIRVEAFGAELTRDERCLPGRVDKEATPHGLRATAIPSGDHDACTISAVRDEAIRPQLLEDLDTVGLRLVQKQVIESGPLDVEAGSVIGEIAERDLRDLVVPDDDAAGFFHEAFLLDVRGHAEKVEIFPRRRPNALSD